MICRACLLVTGVILALTPAASALSPLPFTREFADLVEERFFEEREVSSAKLEAYRSQLQRRRDEVAGVFASALREGGRGRVLPPPWVENRLVGKVVLEGHTRRQSRELGRQPVDLDPRCAAAQWEMLDMLPEADGDTLRWRVPAEGSSSLCDGSLGAFAR